LKTSFFLESEDRLIKHLDKYKIKLPETRDNNPVSGSFQIDS
jgi:hypothetical protein